MKKQPENTFYILIFSVFTTNNIKTPTFRASETEPPMNLFDNPSDMMCKRAAKKYEDPKAWQNQFYRMVTSEIDESLFQPLFKEGRMRNVFPYGTSR